MNLFLLHNEKAGGKEDRPSPDQLIRMIRDSRHTVTYQSTHGKSAHWEVGADIDLVVAAGGDGTVRKAALAVTGRHIPFAIIPLGTANNIAKSLDLHGSAADIIPNLSRGTSMPFDLGIATGPWGQVPFIESAGIGVIARNVSYLAPSSAGTPTHSLRSALQHLSKRCKQHPAHLCTAAVDGREISGRFLLVEAMNARSLGPNLVLAPDSDPGDRQFDFVFLRQEDRDEFNHYLDHPETWGVASPPVEIVCGQRLVLHIEGPAAVHVDDFTWPKESEQAAPPPADSAPLSFSLKIELSAEPVQVWRVSPREP